MARHQSLLRPARQHRIQWFGTATPVGGSPDPLAEWTARPVGRLGRPLLVEIETYLNFFAIARAEAEPHER